MKKQLLYVTLSLTFLGLLWASCDNGNADPVIIDGPPVVESITINSGTVAGEDFTATIVVNDGIQGSTISVLANLTWTITGPTAANGQESLSGDLATVNIAVAGGLTAGDYNLDIVVTDSNGNTTTDNVSFTVASGLFDITGDWSMDPVEGAFKVGPAPGSGEWWQNSAADVAARACHFDDVYTFMADGTFTIDMQDATWLETFQGVDSDQCGTPVDPFTSGSWTYTYEAGSLTLNGRGAAVGLAKVNNEGEISQGAAIADAITYNITSQTEEAGVRRMTLQIEAADGVWWEFLLVSGLESTGPAPIEGTWKMAPEAGALAVGPSAGSNEWWSNSADDVTTRACYFDDTWTFNANGDLVIDMQDETWLETWQGVSEGCGAPLEPFVNDTYSYTFDGSTLTVTGVGAFVGLQKVTNSAEIGDLADAVGEITYNVTEITETTMTLQINYNPGGDGWWQFKLVKE